MCRLSLLSIVVLAMSSQLLCAYVPSPVGSKLPLLHRLAFVGDINAVQHLLATGKAKIDDLDNDGNTALHLTVFNDSAALAERLIVEHGASLDIRNDAGQTYLARAAALLHEEMVVLALEHNADVNAGNDRGETPLWEALNSIKGIAAKAGLERITALLLDAGADPNIVTYSGRSLVGLVAQQGSAASLKQLLDADADPNLDERNILLLAANWARELDKKLPLLMEAGIDIHASTENGFNAVDHAAHAAGNLDGEGKQGILASISVLMAQGARPAAGALARSLYRGDMETAQVLIDGGADLQERSKHGMTPLMAAAGRDNIAMMKKILALENVDAEATDEAGKSALGYARGGAANRGMSALKVLLEYGVDVDNEHGQMAFRIAVEDNYTEMVELLLARITVQGTKPVPDNWIWFYRDERSQRHVHDYTQSKEMIALLQRYGIAFAAE